MEKEKHPGGRPVIYKTPEELREKIDDYFDMCDASRIVGENGELLLFKPYTLSGLSLHLGIRRETLWEYGKKPGFSNTVSYAKLKVENYAEESLYTAQRVTGIMFSLKNNHGWKDKQEIEQTGNSRFVVEFVDADTKET